MRRSEVRVVLDTSAVYTKSAKAVLRRDVTQLIGAFSGAAVRIRWCLPEVALKERAYQMLQEAKALLPALRKLEEVLGRSLGWADEVNRPGFSGDSHS